MKIVTGNALSRAMAMDRSGVITAVGPGVTRLKVGDQVFGLARFKECGALGEAVVTKETFLAGKPESIHRGRGLLRNTGRHGLERPDRQS
jgi:NADPH:quinone reductase-like Zn-dependent oxidoreductase